MEFSPYVLHFTIAPLVGTCFAATSAYYMHNKVLDQLLRFAHPSMTFATPLQPAESLLKTRVRYRMLVI
jgi:hypothetical protein